MKKVIARLKGGLGNQLFCYAAARRLALANNAELVIDHVTGFARDIQHRRRYALDHFSMPARKATAAERLEPFERYRRAAMKWISLKKHFTERHYLEQEGIDFDERLLALKVRGTLYLDGLWQSENYFKDVEQVIREDLRIVPPVDEQNLRMAEKIRKTNAVVVHWREQGTVAYHIPVDHFNIASDYYRRAIDLIEDKTDTPHYFLFSDDPEKACSRVRLPEGRVDFVVHNNEENAYADLWLMSQCRHFIIANSTFSWWGAWLCDRSDKIVIAPGIEMDGKAAWGFAGLLPPGWLTIDTISLFKSKNL